MAEALLDGKIMLHAGDCLDVLDTLPENSVDGCACDPPYHLQSIVDRFGTGAAPARDEAHGGAFARASRRFMGQTWDGGDIAFQPSTWARVLRVLKPGGYLAAFGASKSGFTMQGAIVAAGFEVRENLLDIVDSNQTLADFVGSLNDVQRCAFFKCLDEGDPRGLLAWVYGSGMPRGKPLAKFMDRHYLGDWLDDDERARGAISHSAAFYGSRDIVLKPAFEPIILARKPLDGTIAENLAKWGTGSLDIDGCRVEGADRARFPSNVLHDGSAAATRDFPIVGDGSTARYFFNAKATADDRAGSKHPTIKPIALMRWLVRLITTPGQLVIDPFAGSGSTGEAAFREGRRAILIEREAEYQADIRRRAAWCLFGPEERKRALMELAMQEATRSAPPLIAGS